LHFFISLLIGFCYIDLLLEKWCFYLCHLSEVKINQLKSKSSYFIREFTVKDSYATKVSTVNIRFIPGQINPVSLKVWELQTSFHSVRDSAQGLLTN